MKACSRIQKAQSGKLKAFSRSGLRQSCCSVPRSFRSSRASGSAGFASCQGQGGSDSRMVGSRSTRICYAGTLSLVRFCTLRAFSERSGREAQGRGSCKLKPKDEAPTKDLQTSSQEAQTCKHWCKPKPTDTERERERERETLSQSIPSVMLSKLDPGPDPQSRDPATRHQAMPQSKCGIPARDPPVEAEEAPLRPLVKIIKTRSL